MRSIYARNVNDAYAQGLSVLMTHGGVEDSRNGQVIVAPWPVVTVYENPRERVLFNGKRDANPFFHLFEALWMLAGRNDAAFLTRFAKQLGEYAEDDGLIHGAYGHRWRRHFAGMDQLTLIVWRLTENPKDRQAVLAIWDPWSIIEADLTLGGKFVEEEIGGDDLAGDWKDRPCNTHVYFRVREEFVSSGNVTTADGPTTRSVLDMTVCCRSNDAIWGAYGANAVHFSVLQEYIAAAVGVEVGRYYQMSNNFHVYHNDLLNRCLQDTSDRRLYDNFTPMRMVDDPLTFLDECVQMCLDVDGLYGGKPRVKVVEVKNKFIHSVAHPMMMCHYHFKKGDKFGAKRWCSAVVADDWRLACAEWLERRWK